MGPEHEWQCTSFAARRVPVRARLGPPGGRGGMEDAPDSESGGLTPMRVRPSPPAPRASSSDGRAMDSSSMSSRVRTPRGAPDRSVRSHHLVVAQLDRAPGSGPGGQRFKSVQPDQAVVSTAHSGVVQWHRRSALDRETVVRTHLPEHRRGPVIASSCRSSSIGRAPSCHGGGSGIETRLWRQTLVVKRTITGDYESPVPGSSPGRGAISS